MTRYADSTGTFPFLLGRAFIEVAWLLIWRCTTAPFPFLLGRAFIEAQVGVVKEVERSHFPSFLEGLSLRRRSEALVRKILSDFLSYLERAFIKGA